MHFDYMGDRYALIDCPGSVGFAADGALGTAVADLALVVVDPDPDRALLAEPTLRQLEALGIPHMIFVNKIDQARGSIQSLLEALQPMSASPLIARWIPIRDGEKITGFVDIALERAYYYRAGQASEQKDIPADLADRETLERGQMLEKLADHDDALLEQLLMDEVPDRETVFADLAKETAQGQIVPVLFGSATGGHGVRRLMKALRHEAPAPAAAAQRLGASGNCAFIFKVSHGGAMGRLSYARLFGGALKEGAELKSSGGEDVRIGTLFAVQGEKTAKLAEAKAGDMVAVAKLEGVHAGEWLAAGKPPPAPEVAHPTQQFRARHLDQGPEGRRPPVDRAPQAHRGGPGARLGAGRGDARDAPEGRQRRASQGDARTAAAALRRRHRFARRRRSATRNRSARP